MRVRLGRMLLLAGALPVAAQAGTLRGTVKNGTTGTPAAGVNILLLQLQGGMETVANTKSDAQGQFTFDNPSLGQQPMLVRAVYKGVNFHQPAPPGRDTVTVEVFDPTRDASILNYPTRFVVFQPNGSSLLVGEEYAIQNDSKPPQAYFRADGSFECELPDKAELREVAAWGPVGMPVKQATIERSKNKYAVAFAFRPGQSGVRLSYELPYADNRATLRLPSAYKVGHVVVLAPPGVEVKADGLQPSGADQGMNVYVHDTLPANQALEVSLSGTAPPPSPGGPDAGRQGGAPETSANIQVIPSRLDSLKWPVVGGFAALFVLGALFLMRMPTPAPAGEAGAAVKVPAKGIESAAGPGAVVNVTSHVSAGGSELDSAVNASLEALKEALFRLEVRRQQGKISEEDYSRERARAEGILRNLVRG